MTNEEQFNRMLDSRGGNKIFEPCEDLKKYYMVLVLEKDMSITAWEHDLSQGRTIAKNPQEILILKTLGLIKDYKGS